MNDDNIRVKLFDMDKYKKDYVQIETYTNYINSVLKRLLNDEIIYKGDIKKCIDVNDRIHNYIAGMIKEEQYDRLSFQLCDFIGEYDDYKTERNTKKRKTDDVGSNTEDKFRNRKMKKNLFTR